MYKGLTAIKQWYRGRSLSTKIICLVCLAALLPIGIALLISIEEIQKQFYRQQEYSLNQGYEQVYQALEDKLSRLHNISTMLAVNDTVNLSLKLAGEDRNLAQQLLDFESIDSYAYGMEMAFDSGNIWFYIDDTLPVVNENRGRYRSLKTAQQTEWYQELMNNNGTPTWVGFCVDQFDTSPKYVAITRGLWDAADYSKDIGILAVSIKRNIMEEILSESVEGQILYLETEAGNLLAANKSEGEFTRILPENRGSGDKLFHETLLNGETYLVRSQLVGQTNVYLISMVSKQTVMHATNAANIGIIICYFLVCLIAMFIFSLLSKAVTRRLKFMETQMMLVQDGVLQKIENKGNYTDEIGKIINKYNEMTDQVAGLMQEQYDMGQENMRMELQALQSQINPHFLYNTLDVINWMVQKNETENVRSIIQAMSNFYRLTLSKGQDVVTIGDEVRMCDAYMEIQRRRYRGRILYEADVEESILGCMIPKITLQPFLENAIIHGINEKEDARGVVILNGWMEDGRITLSVTDDGKGFCQNEKKDSGTGSHYGMKNIEKRLELYYGEKIPVQIESSPGVGTCIIINVPVRHKEI